MNTERIRRVNFWSRIGTIGAVIMIVGSLVIAFTALPILGAAILGVGAVVAISAAYEAMRASMRY